MDVLDMVFVFLDVEIDVYDYILIGVLRGFFDVGFFDVVLLFWWVYVVCLC